MADKVTKRGDRNKASKQRLHEELKNTARSWSPSGGSNEASHGPRASGASTAGSGRDAGLDTFSREQV